MAEYLVNGQISTFVPASDRGLHFGDGVFETLAVVQGQPRWWQDHMDRLAEGCHRLGLAMPAQAVLLREVQTACAGRVRCIARIVITRGPGTLAHCPEDGDWETRIVSAHSWPLGLEEASERGVKARICDVRLSVQSGLGGIRHLNRLEQVLAAVECRRKGVEEGLLLDGNDHLISAITANIFLVSGGNLLTPRMDRSGTRGVLRKRVLQAFKRRCELRRITLDMLPEASEAFLCSAIRGIVPVRAIDHMEFPVGPLTRELQTWLAEATGTE